MDHNDIRTLKILEEIDKGNSPSQRALASELNISLGLVNSFIKRLANKGYFKIINIKKNRVKYLMTSRGVAEKSRLTYEYIKLSYQFYNGARQRLRKLYNRLEREGCHRLVFYGVGEFAEIAFISTQGTPIRLEAIIDDHRIGEKFFNIEVKSPHFLNDLFFDKILITAIESRENILSSLLSQRIPHEKIILLN